GEELLVRLGLLVRDAAERHLVIVDVRAAERDPREDAQEKDHRRDRHVVRLRGDELEVRVEDREREGAAAEDQHPQADLRLPDPRAELRTAPQAEEVGDAAVEQRREPDAGDEQDEPEDDETDAGLRFDAAVEQVEIEDEREDRRQENERDRCDGEDIDEVLEECHRVAPTYSGPEIPPSFRTRQKWIAIRNPAASGMTMQCRT